MSRTPFATLRPLAVALAALVALGATACSAPRGTVRDSGVAATADTTTAVPTAAASDISLYDLASTWRDARGDELRLADLAGKPRVVALIYTSCAATCPLILGDLKRIEAAIPAERRPDVGFVLVSLDPARDTPGRLAAWAAESKLDPERWTLLSGSDGDVRELAATLDVRYQAQPDGEIAHTNAITLLDAAGAIAHQQLGFGEASRGTASALRRLLR